MGSAAIFVRNALSNLGRGMAAAVVALILPPILIRHMAPAEYGVWVIVLQISAYTGYLDFGLQTAIGRYIAFADARQDHTLRRSSFSTALAALFVAALLALAAMALAVFLAPRLFPAVPPDLMTRMRWATILLGGSMALGLPASACNGVFIGHERYDVPAILVGGSRITGAVSVVLAVLLGGSLITMATTMAVVNLFTYALQFTLQRRHYPTLRFSRADINLAVAKELFGYCAGLSIMSFSMLLVTGFDLLLVGRFDFAAIAPYSISSTLITFLSGLIYAVANVILPRVTAMHARGDAEAIGKMTLQSSRVAAVALLFVGSLGIVFARLILKLWIGERFVAVGAPILITLFVANILRLIAAPYSVILVAAGKQQVIKFSPLAEGIGNFTASVILAMKWGALGVAAGTLIGSICGIAAHFFYSIPRTHDAIALKRRDVLLQVLVLPVLVCLPLIGLATWSASGQGVRPASIALATSLSLIFAWLQLRGEADLIARARAALGPRTKRTSS